MNKTEYCKQLLKYRGRMMPLSMFLGGKWIFIRIILFGLGIAAMTANNSNVQVLGGLVFGYALGKTVYGLMFYQANRKRWIVTEDLYSWDRITECANE